MPRLLIASITNAPAEILKPHLQTILWQSLPSDWQVDHLYFVDPSAPPDTAETLASADIPYEIAGDKPDDAHHSVEEHTHGWSVPTFHWLAQEKQKLLERAASEHYDALLLCDSDLLLDSGAISSLISCDKQVVSGVFWTRWQPADPLLPQVWTRHPYGFDGLGKPDYELLRELEEGALVPVVGLGAFTLIRSEVFSAVGFWPLVEGLPQEGMWQGEDRHFCVRANRNHVELWADAWPEVFHVYRPSDIQRIEGALERFAPRVAVKPDSTSAVSLVLEPLEEPALVGFSLHLRGILGNLKLLPEMEEAISNLLPGEEAILSVRFPLWWPITAYRGTDKVLRIRLLDSRD